MSGSLCRTKVRKKKKMFQACFGHYRPNKVAAHDEHTEITEGCFVVLSQRNLTVGGNLWF